MSKAVSIPEYSLSEELISSISHGIGAGLAVSACVLGIIKAARDIASVGAISVVSDAIFGAAMIMLYCMSSIYHALPVGVFLLIAGTYTPYALVSLHGALGWTVFGVIWGLTALGIVFNAIDVDRFENVSAVINLVMGWMVVFTARYLTASIGSTGMKLLIIGGVVYSLGAILYGLGDKIRYTHSIFHFFVLGGSILHFLSIYMTVL